MKNRTKENNNNDNKKTWFSYICNNKDQDHRRGNEVSKISNVYQYAETFVIKIQRDFVIQHSLFQQKTFHNIQFSCPVVSDSLWPHELQHARSPVHHQFRVQPNPCLLSRRCHPTISTCIIPFSFCPQSFPASASFQMSQLLASGGQSIGVSTSASVLPVNTQNWSPLGWTGWISLQSKGLSRVYSNTTVQKHQFFGAQLSL